MDDSSSGSADAGAAVDKYAVRFSPPLARLRGDQPPQRSRRPHTANDSLRETERHLPVGQRADKAAPA